MFKNLLAVIFGSFVSVLLIFIGDFVIGFVKLDAVYLGPKTNIVQAPQETLVKNPDPNVPEDFIVSYPGIFDRYYEPEVQERSDYQLWNHYDDILGNINGANVSIRHQLRKGKSYIFNVKYNTDEFGRRITPIKDKKDRKKFIAYFGCSFIWGSCLQDNETIPYYISEMAPDYMPYNYARGASGTNYLMALLENRKIENEMAQKEGVGLYVFIDDHVRRTAGDVSNTASMYFMPYYEYQNGQLTRNGSFLTGRPITTWIYRTLQKTNTFRKFNLSYPGMNENDFRLVCDLIEKSQDNFKKKFKTSEFYVLFHPLGGGYANDIIPCLIEKNIKYLNYTGLIPGSKRSEYLVPYDGHPNVLANKLIAEQIVKDLKLNQ